MEHTLKKDIDTGIAIAAGGDREQMLQWLQAGNNPDQYDQAGWTPLLMAAVRGRHEVVRVLLDNPYHKADPDMRHGASDALPIHLAGHSGDVETAKALLAIRPEHLNAEWDINGHTILLQAAFYGHAALARYLVEAGADASITTARGLGPVDMARQFQNQTLIDILQPYDAPAEKKSENFQKYLQRIAVPIPENEREIQAITDELIRTIAEGITAAFNDENAIAQTMQHVKHLVEDKKAEVNRLGGPLHQPPIIVAATGNNGFPLNENVARLRNMLTSYLLEHGADPTLEEVHPMGVNTIIRACVFNHMDILKNCAQYITPQQLADALNEQPTVNGLTALHDSVLRASTAEPHVFEKYLNQVKWCMDSGARSDIEDFSGRTQKNIAENARDEKVRARLLEIL